jgi:hypothetical protein
MTLPPGWQESIDKALAVLQKYLDALSGNYTFLIIVAVVLAGLAIYLVVLFFQPQPESTMRWTSRRKVRGRAVMQPNKTNGMVTPEVEYPVVVRLLELDAEQMPTAKVLGYSIRPAPGPTEPIFLFLDGEWMKMDPIQSLNHLQIRQIQDEIEGGIRKEIPLPPGEAHKAKKEYEQVTPPGFFDLNRQIWKLERVVSFAGELVRGQLFSFKGGKGLFELISASEADVPEDGAPEERSVLVLEKTIDQYRRAINETWTSFMVSRSSYQEIADRVGEDILASLDLVAQPA